MDRKSNRFVLEGTIIHWLQQIQPKRILVATIQGEVMVKLSKELRRQFLWQSQPQEGSWVKLAGKIRKNGNYKASHLDFVDRLPSKSLPTSPTQTTDVRSPSSPKPPACILVCGKSSCQRQGVGAVIASLKETLRDLGLEAQVEVKTTGCLKKCKKGVNVVFLPDKTTYTQVKPIQASSLVMHHFSPSVEAKIATAGSPK
jgi:(2Fe-2S) ferredoxin